METPKELAVGDLALISFFNLLRVGEYTQKRRRLNTRTIQFRMCDMALKCRDMIIPRDTNKEVMMATTAATLRFSNQKNGMRISLICRSTCGAPYCLVMVLVRRHLNLQDNSEGQGTIILSWWDHISKSQVTDDDMRVAIRRAVVTLRLEKMASFPQGLEHTPYVRGE